MNSIVAVLETMWGDRAGRAPRYFRINPYNLSGKRLYRFVGRENASRLVVTNCCRELVTSAKHHGKPDPKWLTENLTRLKPSVVLVCGVVAQKTYEKCTFNPMGAEVIYLNHPAARTWTKASLRETERKVSKLCGGV